MSQPWFRYYPKDINTHEINRIAREMGWTPTQVEGSILRLLCIASDSPERGKLLYAGAVTVTIDDLSIILCCDVTVTEKFVTLLQTVGQILEIVEGVYKFTEWDNKQFTSDTSKLRMRKMREKQANVTSRDSHGDGQSDGTVTGSDGTRVQNTDNTPYNPPQGEISPVLRSFMDSFGITPSPKKLNRYKQLIHTWEATMEGWNPYTAAGAISTWRQQTWPEWRQGKAEQIPDLAYFEGIIKQALTGAPARAKAPLHAPPGCILHQEGNVTYVLPIESSNVLNMSSDPARREMLDILAREKIINE